MNKIELMNQLKIGKLGSQFTNYSEGCIGDVIDEIANDNCNNSFNDLHKIIDKQYDENINNLYKNLEDSIKYFLYYKINTEKINKNLQNLIDDLCFEIDTNKRLEDYIQKINDYIE